MGARDQRAHLGRPTGRATDRRSRIGSRSRPTGRRRRPTWRPVRTSTIGDRARSARRSPTIACERHARASHNERRRAPTAGGPVAAVVTTFRDHGNGPWGAPGGSTQPERESAAHPVPAFHDADDRHVTVCMHLRDDQATTASFVAELHVDQPPRAWACLGSPCASVFVPFFPPVVPPLLGDPAQWQRFARLRDRVEGRSGALAVVRSTLAPVEHDLWAEADALLRRRSFPTRSDPSRPARRCRARCASASETGARGRSTPGSQHHYGPARAPNRSGRLDMEYNLADLWERVADTVPDHEAMVCAGRRLTFAEADERRDPLGQRARRSRSRPRRPRCLLPLQLDRIPRSDARRVQAPRGAYQRQLPLRRRRAPLSPRRRRHARGRVPS